MQFESLEEMIAEVAAAIRPPERLTVSEAAEKYRRLNNPGSYVGPWKNSMTPYMTEPMDELGNNEFEAVVFVGPAQSGKTDALALNWITHTAICDPTDFMLVQTSQASARDFSIRRVARLYRHSPAVDEMILQGTSARNRFDTQFKSGALLTLSWPAINELSGKPIPKVLLTDYDRMPEDVDGEGSPFDLGKKRTTSFGRYAMTCAESTPGYEIENARWIASTKHEAPPTRGILALYNRGDRRRWFWKCVSCNVAFEPKFGLLQYPSSHDKMEAAEAAVLACPHCGQIYHHDGDKANGVPGKDGMNNDGRWVKDGQLWTPNGLLRGKPLRSNIASFWMNGVPARFTNWKNLVLNYLHALDEFGKTGSEEALKTTVNVDQGDAYLPVASRLERLPEVLQGRAQDLGDRVVPPGARFLIASIDVQKNRFVVQVHGFGEHGEMWIIDRFDIKKSERLDEQGEHFWLSPASYPEDWRLIIPQVLEKTYPLADDTGRVMPIYHTICDSGGREGVTANAYDFWRYLRDETPEGHHRRFSLLKGAPTPNAPRVARSFPDSERKDRKAAARGEVPVLMINTNMLKDQAAAVLDRIDDGGPRVNFPNWLPDSFYVELTVEVRTPKGWDNPKKLRNESWDLLCYAIACSIAAPVFIETLDWTEPPGWAKDWGDNTLIRAPTAEPAFAVVKKSGKSIEELAADLA